MRNSNRWRRFWILFLAPASLAVLQGAKCSTDSADGDKDAPTVQLTVQLKNLDTPVLGDNVHILGPGEAFSASNRLAPGETRNLSLPMRRNETAVFQAGRNGINLPNGSKTCKCTTACPADLPATPHGSPRVEWNGSSLSCVGW